MYGNLGLLGQLSVIIFLIMLVLILWRWLLTLLLIALLVLLISGAIAIHREVSGGLKPMNRSTVSMHARTAGGPPRSRFAEDAWQR